MICASDGLAGKSPYRVGYPYPRIRGVVVLKDLSDDFAFELVVRPSDNQIVWGLDRKYSSQAADETFGEIRGNAEKYEKRAQPFGLHLKRFEDDDEDPPSKK